MTDFGFIKSYDSTRNRGTIVPEDGGDALPFRQADLQQQGLVPQIDARFSYVTQRGDGGHRRAVNLHQTQADAPGPDDQLRQQARAQRG